MSAWGAGALENDEAADFKFIWDDYIADNVKQWGAEKIFNFYRDIYYKGTFPSMDTDFSNELIALGHLFLENDLELPDEFVTNLSRMVSLCLTPDELDEWENPKERKKFLVSFLDAIGGKRTKFTNKMLNATPEIQAIQTEITNYTEWFDNIDDIILVRKTMKASTFDLINELYPELAKTLDDLYTVDVYCDYDLSQEVEKLRVMFMSWWLGFILNLDPEKTRELIQAAEDKYKD